MRVEIEGKPPVEFPDGTDPAVIDMVVKRDFFPEQDPGIRIGAMAAPLVAGAPPVAPEPPAPAMPAPVVPATPIPAGPAPGAQPVQKPSAMELLQRMKGTPVAPGMPSNVTEMGFPNSAKGVIALPGAAARGDMNWEGKRKDLLDRFRLSFDDKAANDKVVDEIMNFNDQLLTQDNEASRMVGPITTQILRNSLIIQ